MFNGKYRLKDLYLERFGYIPAAGEKPAVADLTTVTDDEVFLKRYKSIISGENGAAKRIREVLQHAIDMFSPIFSSHRPAELPELELKYPGDVAIQYVYDYLSDLIQAYDEFSRSSL